MNSRNFSGKFQNDIMEALNALASTNKKLIEFQEKSHKFHIQHNKNIDLVHLGLKQIYEYCKNKGIKNQVEKDVDEEMEEVIKESPSFFEEQRTRENSPYFPDLEEAKSFSLANNFKKSENFVPKFNFGENKRSSDVFGKKSFFSSMKTEPEQKTNRNYRPRNSITSIQLPRRVQSLSTKIKQLKNNPQELKLLCKQLVDIRDLGNLDEESFGVLLSVVSEFINANIQTEISGQGLGIVMGLHRMNKYHNYFTKPENYRYLVYIKQGLKIIGNNIGEFEVSQQDLKTTYEYIVNCIETIDLLYNDLNRSKNKFGY